VKILLAIPEPSTHGPISEVATPFIEVRLMR